MRDRIVGSLAAVFLLGIAGCVSSTLEDTGGGYTLVAILNADGTVTVGNRTVDSKRLVSAIKAAGATRDTAILVRIPADTSKTAIAPLDSQLRTAGFTRILFRGPKHAEVTTTKPARVSDAIPTETH